MLSAVASNPAAESPPADPAYYAIALWEDARAKLERAKAAEHAARMNLKALLFPGAPDAGTAYHPLQNGWRLKGHFALTYSINRDELPEMLAWLSAHSDAGAAASEAVFRYKPELVMTAYKHLLPNLRAVVDTVLTTKPALPTFELVPPKDTANSRSELRGEPG